MKKEEVLNKIKELMNFEIIADSHDIKNLNEFNTIAVNYMGSSDDFEEFIYINYYNDDVYISGDFKFKNLENFKKGLNDFLHKPLAHNPDLISRFVLEYDNDFVEFDEITWDNKNGIDKFKESNPDKELKYLILRKKFTEKIDGINRQIVFYYHEPYDKVFLLEKLNEIIDKECEKDSVLVLFNTLILVTQHFMFKVFNSEGVSFNDGGAVGSIHFNFKENSVILHNEQVSYGEDEEGWPDYDDVQNEEWDPIEL